MATALVRDEQDVVGSRSSAGSGPCKSTPGGRFAKLTGTAETGRSERSGNAFRAAAFRTFWNGTYLRYSKTRVGRSRARPVHGTASAVPVQNTKIRVFFSLFLLDGNYVICVIETRSITQCYSVLLEQAHTNTVLFIICVIETRSITQCYSVLLEAVSVFLPTRGGI